jgi:hypothetical protein
MFGRKRDGINLKRESKERRKVEDVQPWFMAEDDGPELEIQTNRSSNLREDDLDFGLN